MKGLFARADFQHRAIFLNHRNVFPFADWTVPRRHHGVAEWQGAIERFHRKLAFAARAHEVMLEMSEDGVALVFFGTGHLFG